MPLAYALVAVVGLVLVLTWGALQFQVALAGLLNGESVWSKAQKQAVIDLSTYATNGKAEYLARFRGNYALLGYDRWVRENTARPSYDYDLAVKALSHGNTIPDAIPGVLFILHYFPDAPYVRGALKAWRSTDGSIDELETIADQLQRHYSQPAPVATGEIARLRERINTLNDFVEPRTKIFSQEIARGATWLTWVLFTFVFAVACAASLVWLYMARRILASIRGTEERYRLVFDSAADAIVMVDEAEGSILDVNRITQAWTGRDQSDLIGERFAGLFVSLPGQDGIGELRDAAGGTKPVEILSSLASWGSRSVRQAIIRDVTERLNLEQERRIAAEALASIAEGVIIADAERRIVATNAAHDRMTGFPALSRQGICLDKTRSLPDGSPLPASVWEVVDASGHWQGEVQSRRQDGSSYPELLSISAIRGTAHRVQHYVAVFNNISVAKANQRRLEYLATHDPLTDLVNRAEFERQCEHAIAEAMLDRSALAVLFVDLDAFKVVNDSYSHAVGDRLLVKVAERINHQLTRRDLAGRIGGDEFTVLLPNLKSREEAIEVAQRLLITLGKPVIIGEYEIVLSASIGIAGYPLDGDNATVLIANADAAMYVAKSEERNAIRLYSPMMQADARRRLALATELRRALENGEFKLLFQPSIELRTGRIVAVEALLRWQHPERGEIQPGEFIPLAEKLGLIRHIDEWVLDAACAQMRHWLKADLPAIRVAVNVSASWFGHPSFVDSVREKLANWQMPPERLLLEITEGTILRLGDEMQRTMHALHALRVGVAIDDFGTGYSSMSYLKLPAIVCLKIDQSFVRGLPDESNDVAIVEAMLALSNNLGLYTIAEGIEEEVQHEFLLKAGCAEGQGFLYSRPIPATEVERLLRRKPDRSPFRLQLVPPTA
jgi:diguanylate cyclase (GGDEF)-like protein